MHVGRSVVAKIFCLCDSEMSQITEPHSNHFKSDRINVNFQAQRQRYSQQQRRRRRYKNHYRARLSVSKWSYGVWCARTSEPISCLYYWMSGYVTCKMPTIPLPQRVGAIASSTDTASCQCKFRWAHAKFRIKPNWWIGPFHLALIKEMHSKWCPCTACACPLVCARRPLHR